MKTNSSRIHMRLRHLALLLSVGVTAWAGGLSLPRFSADAAQAPGASGQAPRLRIVVLRGEGVQHNVKKGRATRAVVEVRDENDRPQAGVILTFTMPADGPSGTFVDASRMATVTTDSAGRASVSFTPNSVPGEWSMNVSGSHAGQSLSATLTQVNSLAAAAAGISAATIGIIVGVGAAAAVGTAVALSGGNGASPGPSPAPQPGVRIGTGSNPVTIGPPR
jgi:hypothetical protein